MQKGLKIVRLQMEYKDSIEKRRKCISMRYIPGRRILWNNFNKMLHVTFRIKFDFIQYLIKYKIYEVIELFILLIFFLINLLFYILYIYIYLIRFYSPTKSFNLQL